MNLQALNYGIKMQSAVTKVCVYKLYTHSAHLSALLSHTLYHR